MKKIAFRYIFNGIFEEYFFLKILSPFASLSFFILFVDTIPFLEGNMTCLCLHVSLKSPHLSLSRIEQ